MPENKIDERDILNFALNLEYLEAEFYTYATTGKSITSFGIGTKGRAGGSNPTTGGRKASEEGKSNSLESRATVSRRPSRTSMRVISSCMPRAAYRW